MAYKTKEDDEMLKKVLKNIAADKDPESLQTAMDKSLDDKNVVQVQSALRGAATIAENEEKPPASFKVARQADPLKDETPKDDKEDADNKQLLYSAILAAVPGIIGYAAGGSAVGGAGFEIGSKAVKDLGDARIKKDEKAADRAIKQGELDEKKQKSAFEIKKLAQDREIEERKLSSAERIKGIEAKLAGVKTITEGEGKLRDDYQQNQIVKNHAVATEGISKIRRALDAAESGDANAYDDVALIFSYMKTLDPASTVREGEYKTAEQNAPLLEKMGINFRKLYDGKARLTDAQRQQIVAAAERLYESGSQTYNDYSRSYVDIANRQGYNPENVIPGMGAGYQRKPQQKKTADSGFKNPLLPEAQAAAAPPDFRNMSEDELQKYEERLLGKSSDKKFDKTFR